MDPADIIETKGFMGNDLFLMDRVLMLSGLPILQADIQQITCTVYDETDTVIANPPVDIAQSVSDTYISNDPRWTKDKIGYNFSFAVPGASFPQGEQTYTVVFAFTPYTGLGSATGTPFNIVVRHSTVAIPGTL
jgi:hypothetical protein